MKNATKAKATPAAPPRETEAAARAKAELRVFDAEARYRCEEADLLVRGRAEVLSRLFELQEVNAHNAGNAGGTCTDFAGEREEVFWLGLRHLVNDIRDGAAVLARRGQRAEP